MKKGALFILFLASVFYASAQSTGKYQIKFLEINKENSDYGVAILDENKLIFTSALEEARNTKKNYNPRKDLYVGDIDYNGEIINVKPVVNNKDENYNQTGVTYTSDRKTVYFSRNKYSKRKKKQNLAKNKRLELFKADVDANGNWSNIKKLPFNKSNASTGFPVLSADNTQLYFTSDRKESLGKMDIFVVDIHKDGTYSKPKNLGKNVNTTEDETTPFITSENILYFSSGGHKGLGNLDVFAVEVFKEHTSEPYHLASPINSINDDFAYIVNKDNNQGFFTSNRLQGKGFNDLYSFTLEEDTRPGECFIAVDGKVRDKDSKEVLSGATVDLYDKEGNLIESISTYNDGTYKFTVSCANEYKLVASYDNYKKDAKHIEILEENYHSALHTNIDLSKLIEDKPAPTIEKLQPIYYAFDDASISPEAAKEMDKIIGIMKNNTNLAIEASSFTDARGSDSYNMRLSQRRAKAAIEYLKAHGIDASRIKSKAYGEEKMVNQCVNGIDCDETSHQMNRRTEFNFINAQANYQKKKTKQKPIALAQREPERKSKEPEKLAKKQEPIYKEKPMPIVSIKKEVPKTKEVETNKIESNKKSDKTVASNSKTELKAIVKSNKEESKVAAVKTEKVEKSAPVVSVKTKLPKTVVRTENNDKVAQGSSTKTKTRITRGNSPNRAVNYIEEQKVKVIAKLEELEDKYNNAVVEKENYKDSIAVEKTKIQALKKDIENSVETGWSNIIDFKSSLKTFNKKYYELMNKANNTPTFNNNIQKKNSVSQNNNDEKPRKPSRKIAYENVDESISVDKVEVIAMKKNSNGKYSITQNAKKTDLIKVSFKMLENKKIEPGQKLAHIVLQSPEGKVANAKGVFTLKDSNSQKKYTDQTVVDYNKNDVNVTMYIERRGNELEKGVYPVKLFVEGELVAVSNLDLQNPF